MHSMNRGRTGNEREKHDRRLQINSFHSHRRAVKAQFLTQQIF